MPATSPTHPLTVFDLDGVLARRDTMAAVVLSRFARRPWRVLAAVPLFVASLLATDRGRERLNRALVALALRGLDRRRYLPLAARVGQRLGATAVNERAVQELVERAGAGSVVVVTASEFHLARAFLDAAGLDRVRLIASQLAFDDHSPRLVIHNVGEAKVRRLRIERFPPEGAVLFTDSASDLPLARLAREVYLVNPGPRSARRVRAAVPGAVVVRWR